MCQNSQPILRLLGYWGIERLKKLENGKFGNWVIKVLGDLLIGDKRIERFCDCGYWGFGDCKDGGTGRLRELGKFQFLGLVL